MTTIFILSENHTAEADAFVARLTKLCQDRFPVQAATSVEHLLAALSKAQQAVVITNLATGKLSELSEQCRAIVPGTTLLQQLEAHGESDNCMSSVSDYSVLRSSADDFELAQLIASAARQSELLTNMAGCAQRDEVTNLFNRRHFMQRLGEEISLSKRHLSPLCVVVLSINYYRMYLDSYGYGFINALLRFIADKTGGLVRHEDIIARVGDDEIAVLLPRSTEKGAKVFTNRLVNSLNALTFQPDSAEAEEISVCAGVAGFPLPDSTNADADTIMRYARHALHQARVSEDETVRVQLFSEIRPEL